MRKIEDILKEMRERKVNNGKHASDTLRKWADEIEAAFKSQQQDKPECFCVEHGLHIEELQAKLNGIFECKGCGTVSRNPDKDLVVMRKAGYVSCCPERNMQPMLPVKYINKSEGE